MDIGSKKELSSEEQRGRCLKRQGENQPRRNEYIGEKNKKKVDLD